MSGFPKSFIVAGLTILGLYFVVFYGIEGCRKSRGPWKVAFSTNTGPVIRIAQSRLGVACAIQFHDEEVETTNTLPQEVAFDRPRKAVPFGHVIYEDLMQLPGVITLDMFGHEIELLPRTLIVNKREIPWRAQMTIDLWPTNKPLILLKPRPSWSTNQ
jgi:hypothetical protein